MKLLSYLFPQTITTSFSKINGEIKVVEKFGKYAVYVDGAPQSGAEIRLMWEKIIKNLKFKIKNSLILGVGGGDVIKVLNKYFPQTSVTAVELDPVMVEIANKYFSLNHIKKLKIIIDDAIIFITDKKSKEKYDLIVVDLFIGKFNPAGSRISSFLEKLKNKRAEKGIILFNSHYKPDKPDEFENFYRLCQKIFIKSEIIFSYRYNHVLFFN